MRSDWRWMGAEEAWERVCERVWVREIESVRARQSESESIPRANPSDRLD